MTKDEALRLAWDALEDIGDEWGFTSQRTVPKRKEAITAIKEALAEQEQAPMNYYRADAKGNLERTDIHSAQPEQDGQCKRCKDGCPACDARKLPEQEPVAWISPKELLVMRGNAYAGAKDWRVNLGLEPEEGDIGLYTTPPQRTWTRLTDEEIRLQWSEFWEAECHPWAIDFAQAIEAKLKEKNS